MTKCGDNSSNMLVENSYCKSMKPINYNVMWVKTTALRCHGLNRGSCCFLAADERILQAELNKCTVSESENVCQCEDLLCDHSVPCWWFSNSRD